MVRLHVQIVVRRPVVTLTLEDSIIHLTNGTGQSGDVYTVTEAAGPRTVLRYPVRRASQRVGFALASLRRFCAIACAVRSSSPTSARSGEW